MRKIIASILLGLMLALGAVSCSNTCVNADQTVETTDSARYAGQNTGIGMGN